VTGLDWIIVAFAAILASFGFRRGFIVGVLSFGGFAIGAFLGTRVGPLLLPQGSSSPYAPAFGLVGALLAGAILASGLQGVGFWLRRALIIPGIGLLDGLLGAVLGAALGLGIVWILAAVAAQAPSEAQLRADIQRSAILRELNVLLPPSGPILNALARLDPALQLFDGGRLVTGRCVGADHLEVAARAHHRLDRAIFGVRDHGVLGSKRHALQGRAQYRQKVSCAGWSTPACPGRTRSGARRRTSTS